MHDFEEFNSPVVEAGLLRRVSANKDEKDDGSRDGKERTEEPSMKGFEGLGACEIGAMDIDQFLGVTESSHSMKRVSSFTEEEDDEEPIPVSKRIKIADPVIDLTQDSVLYT